MEIGPIDLHGDRLIALQDQARGRGIATRRVSAGADFEGLQRPQQQFGRRILRADLRQEGGIVVQGDQIGTDPTGTTIVETDAEPVAISQFAGRGDELPGQQRRNEVSILGRLGAQIGPGPECDAQREGDHGLLGRTENS